MWQFFYDRILYVSDGAPVFEFSPLDLSTYCFHGTLVQIPMPDSEYLGFDDWLNHFPPEEERALVQNTLQMAQKDPQYRGHIRGISLADSVALLREYYTHQGYEDDAAKNYTLPSTVQVTASISLRHALWCEKDKRFLASKDTTLRSHGMIAPPMRGSHDLRVLQQALRMNIIMGIEVFPGDEKYVERLVQEEILSPFSVSQMIRFRWEKYGWQPAKQG